MESSNLLLILLLGVSLLVFFSFWYHYKKLLGILIEILYYQREISRCDLAFFSALDEKDVEKMVEVKRKRTRLLNKQRLAMARGNLMDDG